MSHLSGSEPSEALNPIGIMDSGVGGLSVLRHIRALLPHEDLLYVADQAHVPGDFWKFTPIHGPTAFYTAVCGCIRIFTHGKPP